MMEDRQVSLKQVLDEIARWVGYLDEDMIYRIQTGLKRLPSAQPEMDCMLKEYGNCTYSETGCSDCAIKANLKKALSSAQPERMSVNLRVEKLSKHQSDFSDLDAQPEPCDDVVSRKAVIEGVKTLHDVVWKNWHEPTLSANVVLDMIRELPSAQSETYKEKLNEIASALSEKFAYMNTCLNERDIILGYLGVKRSCEIHCNTNCTNTKCESHPSFTQPEQRWIPCSERLPEEGHDVLITKEPFKIKGYEQEVIKAKRSVDPRSGEIEWWSPEFGTLTNKAVLAWMPLPKPYRAESEEV